MNANWKVILLLICFVGFYLLMFTWKIDPKALEIHPASSSDEKKTEMINSSELQFDTRSQRHRGVQFDTRSHRHRAVREFYLDQLHSTLPKSPQVYQGTPDYTDRLNYVNKVCRNLNIRNQNFYSRLWLQKRYNLIICTAPKVGSSFWRRTFHLLDNTENITSPFLVGYGTLPAKPSFTRVNNKQTLLKKATKGIFSREPYGRLFSAYVSKLVSPSPFWKTLGTRIVRAIRRNATDESLKCGHDVTFPELVKYVIQGRTDNLHIIPQHRLCSPCDVEYDVIGKMESFQDDAFYLLDSVGALNKDIRFYDFKKEHEQDTMFGPAFSCFERSSRFTECCPMHKVLKRVWRVYQIRGLLDKIQEYPLSEKESSNITLAQFMALAIAAHKKADSSARGNKKEAFLQAYQGVPMEDLKLLQKYYDKDFKLFGYPSEPEDLFKRSNDTKTKHTVFNYFDFTYSP